MTIRGGVKGKLPGAKVTAPGGNKQGSMAVGIFLSLGGKATFKATYTDMTGCTTGVRGKGVRAVVTDAAVFAIIQSLHGEFLWMLFGSPNTHFKGLVVAAVTVKAHFNVALVIKDNCLDR